MKQVLALFLVFAHLMCGNITIIVVLDVLYKLLPQVMVDRRGAVFIVGAVAEESGLSKRKDRIGV
jgi:hypothetical protein